MDPGLLPTALGARGHTRILLQCGSARIACALCATGDEKAGGADRLRAGQSVEEGKVGMPLGTRRDGGVAVGDSLHGDPERSHQRLDHQGIGGMTPASVVNGVAPWMAWRSWAITFAARPGWARKQVARVVRRARWAALSVGQRLSKSQNRGVSLSSNPWSTCGK